MPKPHHTFMLINGKPKIIADAKESRANLTKDKATRVNAVDYILSKTNLSPSKLDSGLKILEDAQKTTKDKIDATKLGKVKEVVDAVKKLCEQIEKLQSSEKEAFSELTRHTAAIVKIPALDPSMTIGMFTNTLDVLMIVLLALINIRRKGTKD